MLINSNATIKGAMKRLDAAASKTLFVIDDNNTFVGSITDGDIRRGLLSDLSLDSNVYDACNKNSYSIKRNFDKEEVINEMEKLDIIFAPILSDDNEIINIFAIPESHKEVINRPDIKLDIPVVIMAGGKGTRMAPFTNVLPKPLIPIGKKQYLS